jgi:hypothetical protein
MEANAVRMTRNLGLAVLVAAMAACGTAAEQAPVAVAVFKDAACGCCSQWVEHLKANGFDPTATNVPDLDAVKAKYNIPRRTQSCHTAIVEGYVVEGHVPAADIRRLLEERPAIAGLAVPAMPVGSPGMEVPGVKPQPYDVLALNKDGTTAVYASYHR